MTVSNQEAKQKLAKVMDVYFRGKWLYSADAVDHVLLQGLINPTLIEVENESQVTKLI